MKYLRKEDLDNKYIIWYMKILNKLQKEQEIVKLNFNELVLEVCTEDRYRFDINIGFIKSDYKSIKQLRFPDNYDSTWMPLSLLAAWFAQKLINWEVQYKRQRSNDLVSYLGGK